MNNKHKLLLIGLIIIGVSVVTTGTKSMYEVQPLINDGCNNVQLLKPVYGSIRCEESQSSGIIRLAYIPSSGLNIKAVSNRVDLNFDALTSGCNAFETPYIIGFANISNQLVNYDSYENSLSGELSLSKGDSITLYIKCHNPFWFDRYVNGTISSKVWEKHLYYYPAFGQGKLLATEYSGCYLTKSDLDKINGLVNYSLPVELEVGDTKLFVESFTSIPSLINLNLLTYDNQPVVCEYNNGGKQLMSVEVFNSGGDCYAYPSRFIKSVQCCDYNDCPYGSCNMETFTCEQNVNGQSCESDLQCDNNGAIKCSATFNGNYLTQQGCVDGYCQQTLTKTKVECCPGTCASSEYCDVNTYTCENKTTGPLNCPFDCCVSGSQYVVKECGNSDDVCVNGECVNKSVYYNDVNNGLSIGDWFGGLTNGLKNALVNAFGVSESIGKWVTYLLLGGLLLFLFILLFKGGGRDRVIIIRGGA